MGDPRGHVQRCCPGCSGQKALKAACDMKQSHCPLTLTLHVKETEKGQHTWSTYCRAAAFRGLMPLSIPATNASFALVVLTCT